MSELTSFLSMYVDLFNYSVIRHYDE